MKHASSKVRETMEMFGGSAAGGRGIDRPSFKVGMQKLGFVLAEEELDAVFAALDHDSSGVITFADMAAGVLSDEYKVCLSCGWVALRQWLPNGRGHSSGALCCM